MKPGAKWKRKKHDKLNETIYMGGELDDQDTIMPKNFARFFTKTYLLIIFLLIATLFIFIFKIWGAIQ